LPGSPENVCTGGLFEFLPDRRCLRARASFARNYGSKGGLAKSADAQRQAFTRALKAALAEGMVNQDSVLTGNESISLPDNRGGKQAKEATQG